MPTPPTASGFELQAPNESLDGFVHRVNREAALGDC